ncbi:MAG TPA: CDP-glycerol glycerophosphotransferase family protein [Actinomycetales bacterium]|nr:CDP-glycerol glycerophosphotransferase family protein [Actinomycetales bacterium]
MPASSAPPGSAGTGEASRPALWAPVLAAPYLALALAAALAPLLVVCALLVLCVLAERWAGRRADGARWLWSAQLMPHVRWLVRWSLVVTALARADLPAGEAGDGAGRLAPALAATVAAVLLTRSCWVLALARGRARLREQVRWQGIVVDGVEEGPAPVREPGFLTRTPTGPDAVLSVEWVLVAGLAAGVLVEREAPVWAAILLTVGALALLLARLLMFERACRSAPPAEVLPRVVAALERLQPEVVVYFSSPASGSYALRVWLDTLRRLRNRTVVLLREPHHLQTLDLTGLAVVVLPLAQQVEDAQVPSMRVALYPTNVVKNNHMIRLPGLQHAFIGHGDSDKAGSFSPVTRVYDEIWVAGPAGRDRYLAAQEGVRPEQIREVSRPQLAGISRRHAATPAPGVLPAVLYAPTWEGFYEESDYCSLADPGLQAVRAMVASGRVRVLFKPHPASGERREDVASAVDEIEALVAQPPHRRVPDDPMALYDAMSEADVLVADVSSVLSDWLVSSRPYVVTNPRRLPADELHERFPTTRGGAVLSPGGDVLEIVDEALGADRLEHSRYQLARYLLGDVRDDPIRDFVDEVAAFVDRADAARAARTPTTDAVPTNQEAG